MLIYKALFTKEPRLQRNLLQPILPIMLRIPSGSEMNNILTSSVVLLVHAIRPVMFDKALGAEIEHRKSVPGSWGTLYLQYATR